MSESLDPEARKMVNELRPLRMPLDAAVSAVTEPNPPLLQVEIWAVRKHTHRTTLRAAAIGARWEIGPQVEPCMVTEAAFDAAVAFAENPHAVVNPPKSKT